VTKNSEKDERKGGHMNAKYKVSMIAASVVTEISGQLQAKIASVR
jgi:hypothetical protein